MGQANLSLRYLRAIASFLFWAAIFSLAYCQAPLYYSNQNQYFLHGLADAGYGYLQNDWLANTEDPTPVFSFLVTCTQRFLHPYAFHLYYALCIGVYVVSLQGLFVYLAGDRATPGLRLSFLALLLLFHSALARWASYRLFGLDYPFYFQAGVAAQYILGPMFQPSTFGVFLILAIYLFIKDWPFAAVFSACLAATVHSTYLLSAGMLTVAFLCVLLRERRFRQALLLAGWALLLALPVVVFLLATFRPTSPERFAIAQHILVHVRIPHHCLPQLWCDGIALGQVAWVLLALGLIRGTRLFAVLTPIFLLALCMTLVQIFMQSDTLALLFPWRISAVLVPIATAIILGRIVIAAARWFDTTTAIVFSAATLVVLVIGGVGIMVFRQGFQSNLDEVEMMDFVRATKSPEDIYLLPVKLPDRNPTTRGSLSSDFKPLADKKQESRLIPIDLQRFRLYTGAAVFVDFKAIPYKDTDVLEWQARLQKNQEILERLRAGKLDAAIEALRENGITHVVMTADHDISSPDLKRTYTGETYCIYHLQARRSAK